MSEREARALGFSPVAPGVQGHYQWMRTLRHPPEYVELFEVDGKLGAARSREQRDIRVRPHPLHLGGWWRPLDRPPKF